MGIVTHLASVFQITGGGSVSRPASVSRALIYDERVALSTSRLTPSLLDL